MKELKTINELIHELNTRSLDEYEDVLKALSIEPKTYAAYLCWSEDCYTRNIIHRCPQFEVLLMCWDIDQGTLIHSHGGRRCWMRIMKGQIRETLYQMDKGEPIQTKKHLANQGDICYVDDQKGYHRLENADVAARSISLHIYALPIESFYYYDPERHCLVSKNLE